MEVVYITIGVSIIVAVFFFIVFIKSVKSGQYEDTYTPSVRMLFDDELVKVKKEDLATKQTEQKENQQE
jgi:cbb3-type cytochrome oxidase maturation protein